MKLREGNVFTGVCHSVHREGESLVPLGIPGPRGVLGGSLIRGEESTSKVNVI